MELKGDTTNWDIEVDAQSSTGLSLRELLRYKDLLVLFVRRDFVALYKQTILGPLWFLIQPVIQALMFYFIFNRVANIQTDGIPPFLFYLTGSICWNYFADCLNKTSTTFASNAQIFGKVYFPRLVVPLSVVVSNMIKLIIQFVLFAIVWAVYKFQYESGALPVSWKMLLFPFMVATLALQGLGFGLLISSLTTKYRDLKYLMTFGVQLWMYATPIIYPYSQLDGTMAKIAWFNPIMHVVELFKNAFLGSGYISAEGLIYAGGSTIIILLLGVWIFNRTEKNFMDTV